MSFILFPQLFLCPHHGKARGGGGGGGLVLVIVYMHYVHYGALYALHVCDSVHLLILKELSKIVADDILNFFVFFFRENKTWHFM